MACCNEPIIYRSGCHKDNCTQPLPQVKLDPSTRTGAACALAGYGTLPTTSTPLFIEGMYFAPSK